MKGTKGDIVCKKNLALGFLLFLRPKSVFMKRILLAIVFCFSGILIASAQPVGYTHKAFAPDGCIVNYRVVFQENVYYIEVHFESDLSKMTEKPTLMIRTFSEEVIKLSATDPIIEVLSQEVERDGVKKTITAFSSTVKFPVTADQLEALKNGISKIRLSTEPYEHEKEFKKDKIGKPLYESFIKKKNGDADF
jgi:hypothetical protein